MRRDETPANATRKDPYAVSVAMGISTLASTEIAWPASKKSSC